MGKSNKPVKKHDINNPRGNKTQTQKKTKQTSTLSPPSTITTHTVPPPNWPSNMPYLSSVHIPPTLPQTQLSLYHPETLPRNTQYSIPNPVTYSPTPNPLVQIQPITTPTHPAYPQSGLFAARPLPPGSHILDYTGLLHECPLPSCSTSDYDLAFLDRDASLAIDGATMGNESRFVNDYHGVREGPNAMFEEYFVKVRGRGGKVEWEARMGVWVLGGGSGIGKGEEICVSYGKGWWRARRGVMEEVDREGETGVVV